MQNSMMEMNKIHRVTESSPIALQSEQFWWDKAKKILGAGYSAPDDERDVAERLMRK